MTKNTARKETEEDLRCVLIIKKIVSENADLILRSAKVPKLMRIEEPFSVSITQIDSGTRISEAKILRHLAMAIIKELCELTLKGIGRQFENRDHSTIIHALEAISDMRYTVISFDRVFQGILEKCKEAIECEKLKSGELFDYSNNSTPIKPKNSLQPTQTLPPLLQPLSRS